jgi:hypothetical protein
MVLYSGGACLSASAEPKSRGLCRREVQMKLTEKRYTFTNNPSATGFWIQKCLHTELMRNADVRCNNFSQIIPTRLGVGYIR